MSDPEAVDRMCKKISQLTRVIYLLRLLISIYVYIYNNFN